MAGIPRNTKNRRRQRPKPNKSFKYQVAVFSWVSGCLIVTSRLALVFLSLMVQSDPAGSLQPEAKQCKKSTWMANGYLGEYSGIGRM